MTTPAYAPKGTRDFDRLDLATIRFRWGEHVVNIIGRSAAARGCSPAKFKRMIGAAELTFGDLSEAVQREIRQLRWCWFHETMQSVEDFGPGQRMCKAAWPAYQAQRRRAKAQKGDR